MPATKKTRAQLKSQFVADAIPIADEFAALIAAGIDQPDDGISADGTTVSLTKPVKATQGVTIKINGITIGVPGAMPPIALAMNVFAPVTWAKPVTFYGPVKLERKIVLTNGLDVTGIGMTVGSIAAGLSATVYSTVTIAKSTTGGQTTGSTLNVSAIAPYTTSQDTNLLLAGQGASNNVKVTSVLRVDSIVPTVSLVNLPSFLRVTDDGNVVVYAPTGTVVWSFKAATAINTVTYFPAASTLVAAQRLFAGQSIRSPNGAYKLDFQADGNLVLYDVSNRPIWASNTWRSGNANVGRTELKSNGDLVVYNADGRIAWASSTTSSWRGPATSATGEADKHLLLAGQGTGKVNAMSPVAVDSISPTTTNGNLKLGGNGTGKVQCKTPLALGTANTPRLPLTMYSSLSIMQNTTNATSPPTDGLFVDSISPSNDKVTDVDLTLAGKGAGVVRVKQMQVDKLVPASTATNANLQLGGTTSVVISSPLQVGYSYAPTPMKVYGQLQVRPGTTSGKTKGVANVDNITAYSTNADLVLKANGTAYVSVASKLVVNGGLTIGPSTDPTANPASLNVGTLEAETILSTVDGRNLTLSALGTGTIVAQKSVQVSAGNVTTPWGNVTIGASGETTRTVTVYGSLNAANISFVRTVPWTVATLAPGNANNTASGCSSASYRKDDYDLVVLRGSVRVSSSAPTVNGMYLIFTLPVGCRPVQTMWFRVVYGSGTSRSDQYVRIDSSGQVCASTSGSYFELDAISFRCFTPIPVVFPSSWLKLNLNGNTNDTSGNNRAGTASKVTYVSDARFGTVASFDGSNSLITFSGLTCPDVFTFAVWAKRASNNTAGYSTFIEFGGDSPTLLMYYNVPSLYGGATATSALDTEWHHIAATRNATESVLYVDGARVASGAANIGRSGVNLTINAVSEPYIGLMAKVNIFDSALNADQIRLLYQS